MTEKNLLGIDIGSEFIHSVVMNSSKKIIYTPASLMHFGNISQCMEKVYDELAGQGINQRDTALVFTGSCGKSIADFLGASHFYETITIPKGASFLKPDIKYVFHIGARDAYFFEIESAKKNGNLEHFVTDVGINTKCGGGSGLLIAKQSRRLFQGDVPEEISEEERMKKMYALSIKAASYSDKEINVGGRCGVVIQSDMIHLQNKGESLPNIIRGLFERITENYKNDVIRIRTLDSSQQGLFSGGVAANEQIKETLGKKLNVKIIRPEHYQRIAAIGAVLIAHEKNDSVVLSTANFAEVQEKEREKIPYAKPLSSVSHLVKEQDIVPIKKIGDVEIYKENYEEEIHVVLGIDGGSTTTKAAVVKYSQEKLCLEDMLATICIETHGRPVEAAQTIFREIKNAFDNRLKIKAAGYTGSSGALYYKLFTRKESLGKKSADILKDEITCHALGVKYFNPRVDTIFELGGQDAKFTRFREGSVEKGKMNLSCMAGTGQTMQNMIKTLGLSFAEFDELALKAQRTPIIDDSCGVFTEAGISSLVGLGSPKEEISAAIAYGCIGGYIHKFVGNEKLGNCISAQGGPFRSKACLHALALHTRREVYAFPHRQLFGAFGAAIAADNNFKEK